MHKVVYFWIFHIFYSTKEFEAYTQMEKRLSKSTLEKNRNINKVNGGRRRKISSQNLADSPMQQLI